LLADMEPADLAAVGAALDAPASAGPSQVAAFFELLREYLEL
jgi:hypothetical protein